MREPAVAPHARAAGHQPDGDTRPWLVGLGPDMCRVRAALGAVAAAGAPALITGEAGTGKTLATSLVHDARAASAGPLYRLDCRSQTPALDLGELVAGAARRGAATLVLGNVDFLSAADQERLAGLLTGEPLCARGQATTVQVLATACRPFDELVTADRLIVALQRQFRDGHVHLPALRHRREDVPLLVGHFARRAPATRPVSFAGTALAAMRAYSWPGNVVELKTVVARLIAGADTPLIGMKDLPVGIRPRRPRSTAAAEPAVVSLADTLLHQLVSGRESFWTSVHPQFMRREITRADIRQLVDRGLHLARGRYDLLMRLFNMPLADQRRFVSFLRRYDCEPRGNAADCAIHQNDKEKFEAEQTIPSLEMPAQR